jgi:putative FmdB family regulatory protein
MPIYSYRCHGCGSSFDELKPMSERHEHPCPECGVTAKQRITPVAFDNLGMGVDPDFATFGDRWERMHRDQKAKEEKSVGRHGPGEYGKAPGS